ncbi:hypothetical protein HIM_02607 [Hirsutella minnesotensis 3608]|nr:hypothetical protein HIM_02607 [Hirsutella minnesotensis 3608]
MERDSAAKKKGYTAKSYQKALSEGLLLVYDGTRRFQQDNARIHNFGGTPQFLQLHGVEIGLTAYYLLYLVGSRQYEKPGVGIHGIKLQE